VTTKLLVIDDDAGLLSLLKLGLERDGFEVIAAETGGEGLRQAYALHPDAIVLDIMMPDMDGWTVCQRLRQVCDTPIIILTALSEKQDVVRGLSLGADDYLTKPCSFEELKARIRTAMRRSGAGGQNARDALYDDGRLRIDRLTGDVQKSGEKVNLTPTETRLLLALVRQPGRIVPHRELLIDVWGPEYVDEVKYLGVYICYLRRKIEKDASHPQYILTKHRVGYSFTDRRDHLQSR